VPRIWDGRLNYCTLRLYWLMTAFVVVVVESIAVHGGLRESCVVCEFLHISEPWTLCISGGTNTGNTCSLSKSASITPGPTCLLFCQNNFIVQALYNRILIMLRIISFLFGSCFGQVILSCILFSFLCIILLYCRAGMLRP